MRNLVVAASLIGMVGCGAGERSVDPPAAPESSLEYGERYSEWFYEGELESLWDQFSTELRGLFVDVQGLDEFRAGFLRELGAEEDLLDERVISWLGADLYYRVSLFSEYAEPVWLQWGIDSDGRVEMFRIEPGTVEASSPYLDYRTRTDLRLPFDGEWFVFWGGRSTVENYHAAASDQRFAYDLVIARDGQTHSGPAEENESYFCFGEPILAPGAGRVVEAEDGVSDNVPGEMNASKPLGNHVVLDHGNDEYSFIAHLREGSVRVGEGDRVEAGKQLGECGNSGHSSEPHLHYHLQTTPDFGAGEGLPAQFLDYTADGEPVERGEPARGERIRARAPGG